MKRSDQSLNIHIGEVIRRARKDIGMTQTTLASEIGVTFQQIQKYEKGINSPNATRLLDLSGALDISIEDFFLGYDQ
jgi:transcriptional regulator with XRE-family HTH domain